MNSPAVDKWKALVANEIGVSSLDQLHLWSATDGFESNPAPLLSDVIDLPYYGRTIAPLRFNTVNNEWTIHFEVEVTDVELANKRALHALSCGANGLTFNLMGHALKPDQWAVLLKDIQIDLISIGIRNVLNPRRKQQDLFALVDAQGLSRTSLMGGIWLTAPIYAIDIARFNDHLLPLLINAEGCTKFGSIGADCTPFHIAGGNIPQQLGLSLALGEDVIIQLRNEGVKWETIAAHFGFLVMLGPSFLPEVARMRLQRMLWARLLDGYGCSEKHGRTYVHAMTSALHRSSLDTPVNLLRANAQAMSAALGGADAITVLPFRRNKDQELADRMTINTQLIMHHEAGLSNTIDPMAGSYELEHLTDKIGQAAWDIFKQISTNGGYFEAVRSGVVAEILERTNAQYQAEIAEAKRIVIGVNKYPTPFKEANDLGLS